MLTTLKLNYGFPAKTPANVLAQNFWNTLRTSESLYLTASFVNRMETQLKINAKE